MTTHAKRSGSEGSATLVLGVTTPLETSIRVKTNKSEYEALSESWVLAQVEEQWRKILRILQHVTQKCFE